MSTACQSVSWQAVCLLSTSCFLPFLYLLLLFTTLIHTVSTLCSFCHCVHLSATALQIIEQMPVTLLHFTFFIFLFYILIVSVHVVCALLEEEPEGCLVLIVAGYRTPMQGLRQLMSVTNSGGLRDWQAATLLCSGSSSSSVCSQGRFRVMILGYCGGGGATWRLFEQWTPTRTWQSVQLFYFLSLVCFLKNSLNPLRWV